MTRLVFFLLYLAVSLLGLYKLKSADVGLNPQYLTGMAIYVFSFFLWMVLLRWYPLSIVFPLAAGSIIVGTQFLGVFLLGERFDIVSVVAVSFILTGLFILASIDYIRGAI